jgi:hypothetical protein
MREGVFVRIESELVTGRELTGAHTTQCAAADAGASDSCLAGKASPA